MSRLSLFGAFIALNMFHTGAFQQTVHEKEAHVKQWLQEQYPNPGADSSACRTQSGRLCDPDKILTESDIRDLDKALQTERKILPYCSPTENPVDMQFAVALVRKTDLTPFGTSNNRQDKAAEVFARYLHDTWGVGVESVCGGTGILIFLSDLDRTIYVSRGKALESVLTDRRLDKVIEHMKPYLQKHYYVDALKNAIEEVENLTERGKPRFWERVGDWFVTYSGFGWLLLLFGLAFRAIRQEQKRRREYAQVASHLDELDRARAEALQGRFRAVSCPICLEHFPSADEGNNEERKGSDGQPVKLLRCGHVFDDTCWAEWVSSGQGQVDKCPICQQDVGRNNNTANRTENVAVAHANEGTSSAADESVLQQREEQRIVRQYNRERNFRLARLGYRYPQYIRPQQIQRWTQSTYNGSLVRDPSFVQSDPRRASAGGGNQGSGSSGSWRGGGSFGGGSSSGGRGGRW